MSNEELITKAREIAREFLEVDPQFPEPGAFTEVRLRDTATIEFTRPNRTDRMQIVIDRQTGELITASYAPSDSQPNAA